MNRRMMNRLYMLENVQTLLENEGAIFKDDAQFQSLHNDLQSRIQQLQTLRGDLLIAAMPLSERKAAAKKVYAKKMSRLVGLMRFIASEQQLDQTLQFLSNAPSRIYNGNMDTSIALSRELLEIATTHKTELEAMSRGKAVLESAEEALEEFNDIALGPMRRIKKHSELKGQFESLVMKSVAFVRLAIKPFFFSWEDDQPDFYSLFLRTMSIPDFGHSSVSDEEDFTSEGTPTHGTSDETSELDPVSGVNP